MLNIEPRAPSHMLLCMRSTTELHLQAQVFRFYFEIYFGLVCTCVCEWCIRMCEHARAGVCERLEARSTHCVPSSVALHLYLIRSLTEPGIVNRL